MDATPPILLTSSSPPFLTSRHSTLSSHLLHLTFSTKWGLAVSSLVVLLVVLVAAGAFLFEGGGEDEEGEGLESFGTEAGGAGYPGVSALAISPLPPPPLTASNLLPSPSSLSGPQAAARRKVYDSLLSSSPSLTSSSALSSLLSSPPPNVAAILSTGRDGGVPLIWTAMALEPNTRFPPHSHGNVELVHCARGALHEFRVERGEGSEAGEWIHGVLEEGEWTVNQAGSVHLSFTDVSSGCLLLVLWSGAHGPAQDGGETLERRVEECTRECWGREGEEEGEGDDDDDERDEDEGEEEERARKKNE